MQHDSSVSLGMETGLDEFRRCRSEMSRSERNRSFHREAGPFGNRFLKRARCARAFGRPMYLYPIDVLARFCRAKKRLFDPYEAVQILLQFCNRHAVYEWHENSFRNIRDQSTWACRFDHSGFVCRSRDLRDPIGEFCSLEREFCYICLSIFGVVYSASGERISKREVCSDGCYKVKRWTQSGMARGYGRHDPPLLAYATFRINKRQEKLKRRKLDRHLLSGMNQSNG